ncbi:MAG TPA: hypothetical protein VN622_05160 [Clostridia bacterium]|nr:hypothetical protein [Clostridia bacterium]
MAALPVAEAVRFADVRATLEPLRADAPRVDAVRVDARRELAARVVLDALRGADFARVRLPDIVRDLARDEPVLELLRAEAVAERRVPVLFEAVEREPLAARLRPELAEVRRTVPPVAEALRLACEDARPRTERRLAFVSPSARASAVSLAINLLKLLFWPRAVVSWYSSASPRSSNFWNQLSQEISSRDWPPV